MLRVTVDFNARDEDGVRIWINSAYNKRLLDDTPDGTRIIGYETSDIEVEGTLGRYIREDGEIFEFFVPDWSTLRDI